MSLKVIYFQSIFLIDLCIQNIDLYAGIWNNFTKLLCSRELKKKTEIVVKRSRLWPSSTDIIG